MSFFCSLHFVLSVSGFFFGAVLAVPSVPKGCLRASLGGPLRTARGTQKGPRYRRDLLFLGSLWGPLGCSVGSRTLFFWPILLMSSRGAYEVAPQELAWVGCSKPLCFTRFWARSGCGGLAWGRAWEALGAFPGASRGLSGAHRDPQGRLQRRLWQLLGDSGDLWGFGGLCGPLGGFGGLRGLLRASPDALSRLLSFALSRMLTKLSLLTCFPFQLFQVCKPPLSLERCVVFGKYGPHVLARRPFRLVKHMVFGRSVF